MSFEFGYFFGCNEKWFEVRLCIDFQVVVNDFLVVQKFRRKSNWFDRVLE